MKSKPTGKRGFVAPQPQPFTLFADRLTALRAASQRVDDWQHDPADPDAGEAELGLRADAEDRACEALIATPAQTTVEVADKVNALFRRWTGGEGDLRNAQERQAVAAWPDTGQICDYRDFAQCLLALYLDLTGLPAPSLPARAAPSECDDRFQMLKGAYEQAEAAELAAFAREREEGFELPNEELDRLHKDRTESLWALMLEPAPNLDALAWKLEHGIDVAHTDYVGESAQDAATISRLLGEKAWDGGCIPAVALQDVLRLAGRHGPVTEAKPNPFDAGAFILSLRHNCGAEVYLDGTGLVRIHVGRPSDGPADLVDATNRWDALTEAERQTVVAFLNRAAGK